MRKLYILLVLILGPLVTVLAQPTVMIGDGEACTGETFCVPFTVNDFTNINSLRYSISYDTSVIRFTTAQNFNADMIAPTGNLGTGLFTESMLGNISFSNWATGDTCSNASNIGVTLVDGETIFDLCFEAVGDYGEQSSISITNTPTSINCTRNATVCNNIGLFTEDGEVTLCVRELNVTATDVSGNTGDQVCVDFVVDGFDQMKGMQFTVNYDPGALDFVNLFPNTDIPSNSDGSYGDPTETVEGAGTITVAWTHTVEDPPSISVVDGTTFFTVCFDILADCETSTAITFGNEPTEIQGNNEDPANPNLSQEIPIRLNSSIVEVGECDPEGVQIVIDCGDPVEINDIVCVDFLAGDNFEDVSDLEYLMSWNPNILEYVSVDDPGNLPSLDAGDFDTSNVDNGILGLEWSFTAGPGPDMNDQEVIYEVCFRVVGIGGDSPIQILTPGVGVSNDVNIGIAPENCNVQVIQPESLLIDFGDLSVPLNGTDCVPVTTSNFNAMLDVEFSMAWDETIWLHTGTVQNIHPSLISNGPPTFTPIGVSSLAFQFSSLNPVTIPDDAILFEACFQAVGAPGDCDSLITVGFPFPESAITETSGGGNVGIETFAGDLCVLFPDGFGLTAENTTGGWLDTVCMDFTVESFDDITAAEFSVNWDPTVLEYVSSSAIGWAPGDVAFSVVPAGTLETTYTPAVPDPLADGEVAFEVCFQLIGDPNDCYGVSIQNDPLPTVETTGGPGSIVITDGEICVEEQIVIREIIITPPSCPGLCDGFVQIIVEEWSGQGFIGTTWLTDPNQFTPLMLEDACEGELIFTIFDNISGVSLTDTINLVSDGVIPTAVINGDDTRLINCTDGQVLISAQDEGPDVTYTWWMNTVGGQFCGDERTVFATSPGSKILVVTDINTLCTATDTVLIMAPELPEAIVEPVDQGITCLNECVTLQGSGIGDNLVYQWIIEMGDPETVDSTTIQTQEFIVCGPGRYRLKVTDTVTGCMNSTEDPFDEVIVADDGITPNACVNPVDGSDIEVEQNCDGTPTTFDASCSNNDGLQVTYEWFSIEPNGDLTSINTGLTTIQSELGTYAMLVTEMTTGCTDTAFATIIPNSNAPAVGITPPPAFTCATDSIILSASLIPNDPTFTFEWIPSDGGSFGSGSTSLSPSALTPGTYRLLVTNPANLCEADSTVIIEDLTAPPIVDIANLPEDLILDCITTSLTLDGTPSDDDMSYQWCEGDGTPISGETMDTLVVNTPGMYILKVTNLATSCTAADTVTVSGEFETPMLTPSLTEGIVTCGEPEVSTTVTVAGVTMFTVSDWTPMDGVVSTTDGGLTVTVNAPGIYNLVVTSDISGCTAEIDFVVQEDFNEPAIDVAEEILTMTCQSETVELSGAGSATGQNITYLWETVDGDGDADDPTALVTSTMFPGTYLFTVTDTLNGCFADTLVRVLTDTISPVGTVAPVEDLTCADLARTVTMEVSGADNFVVNWFGDPMPTPDNQPTTTITAIGLLTGVVTNTDNACQDSVFVMINGDLESPELTIADPDQMDCGDESVTLSLLQDASLYSSIQWLSIDPAGPLGTDPTQEVDALGEYIAMVTAVSNGCTAADTVMVTTVDDLTLPTIADPGLLPQFDCSGDPITIDVSATGDATDYSDISWMSDNAFDTTLNPFIIDALEAGVFTITVELDGPVPGCVNSLPITITLDGEAPDAIEGPDVELACGACSTLDASSSTPASDVFVYEWLTVSGADLTVGIDGPTPEVCGPGEYRLVVRNVENFCTDTSAVMTVTELPADFAITVGDLELGCGDAGTLNAMANIAPSATVDYNWIVAGTGPEIEDGTATPGVSAEGMYQLIITDTENGCVDTSDVATVTVLPADFAITVGDVDVVCGETGTLNAIANIAPSVTVDYNWIVVGAGPEIEDGTATPAVSEEGMYQLIVTDTENGCTDTSNVATVSLLLPPAANAGDDQALCDGDGDLSANLPTGVNGLWTTTGGAIVDMPDAPATMVSSLDEGANSFVWTLSTDVCPDYSADTVVLSRAPNVVANPDILELASDEVMGEISLIANDITGGADYEITIVSPPAFGAIDTAALAMGNLRYLVNILEFGETELAYELCNTNCPNLCDTAIVSIVIDPRDDTFVPNTITPNDDGANDQLVFDVLLFNPAEDFPDNELIIFNRWGDIIFEAKPYNNDWNGLNLEGKPVPEATYYYILRLNIGKGELLRGDVTVIR